jgi:hypothetical protein
MHGFGSFDSAARFCCAFDELRNYLRPRSTIREPITRSEQRRAFLDRLAALKEAIQAVSSQETVLSQHSPFPDEFLRFQF